MNAATSAAMSVALHYRRGAGPRALASIAADLRLTPRSTRSLLDRLTAAGVLSAVEAETSAAAFLPAQPLERIEIATLLDLACPAASSATGESRSDDKQIRTALAERFPPVVVAANDDTPET